MSLVIMFVFEFVAWVAFNRATPFSTSRLIVAQTTAAGFAGITTVYLALWSIGEQAPFINLEPVLWFAVVNGVLAVICFVASQVGCRAISQN